MNPLIEVTDRDGWFKAFALERTVILLGSDGQNDVALPAGRGQGVESRHVQLLFNRDEGLYRVVNMSRQPLTATLNGQSQSLAPMTMAVLPPDSTLQVGDYRVTLRVDGGYGAAGLLNTPPQAANIYPTPPALPPARPAGVFNAPADPPSPPRRAAWMAETPDEPAPVQPNRPAWMATPPSEAPARPAIPASANGNNARPALPPAAESAFMRPGARAASSIGLMARWVSATLSEDTQAEAVLLLSNRGARGAVQFRLSVTGLPAESFEIPPLPILFPNAETQIRLIFHYPPNTVLRSGQHTITFTASAPEAYPNEQAVATLTLSVPTVYRHTVTMRALN